MRMATGGQTMRTLGTPFRLAAVATLLFFLGAPLRADNLDLQLVQVGPRLLKQCRDKGYRNVGTLKFRVQIGNTPAPGTSGPLEGGLPVVPPGVGEPLSSNLADRLEN